MALVNGSAVAASWHPISTLVIVGLWPVLACRLPSIADAIELLDVEIKHEAEGGG